MAITEKEFQVPVGSHTDEEFSRLVAKHERLFNAVEVFLCTFDQFGLGDGSIEIWDELVNAHKEIANGRQSDG